MDVRGSISALGPSGVIYSQNFGTAGSTPQRSRRTSRGDESVDAPAAAARALFSSGWPDSPGPLRTIRLDLAIRLKSAR